MQDNLADIRPQLREITRMTGSVLVLTGLAVVPGWLSTQTALSMSLAMLLSGGLLQYQVRRLWRDWRLFRDIEWLRQDALATMAFTWLFVPMSLVFAALGNREMSHWWGMILYQAMLGTTSALLLTPFLLRSESLLLLARAQSKRGRIVD